MRRAVLFTDLDGTLLDHHDYRPGPAHQALHRLLDAGVEVVFCSSKTLAEQRAVAEDLGVDVAMVVENGAAVHLHGEEVTFGIPYEEVRRRLAEAARRAPARVRGYGDMTVSQVASLTGLEEEAAARARQRRFSESFLIEEGDADRLAKELAPLRMSRGGRVWTAAGEHDKGTAVRFLLDLWEPVSSFGVGDSENDLPFLEAVDLPMLVPRPDGSWVEADLPGLVRLEGAGPEGWCRAAELVMAEAQRGEEREGGAAGVGFER